MPLHKTNTQSLVVCTVETISKRTRTRIVVFSTVFEMNGYWVTLCKLLSAFLRNYDVLNGLNGCVKVYLQQLQRRQAIKDSLGKIVYFVAVQNPEKLIEIFT